MDKKQIKRKPTYKQMAFETAVRNPERYIDILRTPLITQFQLSTWSFYQIQRYQNTHLTLLNSVFGASYLKKIPAFKFQNELLEVSLRAVLDFEGLVLDDDNLLQIVSKLYIDDIVSSKEITVFETTSIDDIKGDVKVVNSTRKADGGFPSGYASRFWTYMRTPSEFGFVYARYNQPFKLSRICKKLISGEIDEQEAFSIQSIKYNRKNPYRNVSNDFNFFTFVIKLLLELHKKGKSLSYEQFIVAMFSQNGNVDEFVDLLENNKFKDFDKSYEFVKKIYKVNTKFKTITQDYPDVVRRVFIISGFISIRFTGKKLIQINERKLNFINKLLTFNFKLSEEEKENALSYFSKLDTQNKELIDLVKKSRKEDAIDGKQYINKIFDLINDYEINEDIIIESIKKIGKKRTVIDEFKEIPEPLKLEFFISILIALKYGKKYAIRPNYKVDHIGKPYSHAPGNIGDIEVFSKEIYWLIEVTLIRNKTQQLNHETTSVIRHLYSNKEFNDRLSKYLSFVAPVIHQDVREFYDFSIVRCHTNNYEANMKPYDLQSFVEITRDCKNLVDMQSYSRDVIEDFRKKLS